MTTMTVNLSQLHPKAKTLARLAAHLGWRVRQNGRGVYLVSPIKPEITVALPPGGQFNNDRARAATRKVLRYSDQMKVIGLEAWVADTNVSLAGDSPLKDMDSDSLSIVEEHLEETIPQVKAPIPGPQSNGAAPTALPPTQDTPSAKTLISERPWLAKVATSRDRGNRYESRAVLTRTWSDGTVDYVCAWPGCDWSSTFPRSVARHYGRRKDHDIPASGHKQDSFAAEPWEPEHRPDGRVERQQGDLPLLIAQHVIEARGPRAEHEDSGPLTPEQVLERIRKMVDDGSYARHLEAEEQLRVELAQAQQRCAELESNWNALDELIHGANTTWSGEAK